MGEESIGKVQTGRVRRDGIGQAVSVRRWELKGREE